MNWYLDGQILASEASRLQIGAANCNQRGGGGRDKVTFRHWTVFCNRYTQDMGRTFLYNNKNNDWVPQRLNHENGQRDRGPLMGLRAYGRRPGSERDGDR